MSELIIIGFGASKKIDLANTNPADVMAQLKADIKDMAAAEKEKEAAK
jgi:hypothetical protein